MSTSIAQGNHETAWAARRSELLAFARSRVRDECAAEDIVQDVLAKAVLEHDRLRDPGRLRAWLYQCTRNAIIDLHRKTKPTEDLPDELEEADHSEDEARDDGLARCMTLMLQSMPEAYRDAVVFSELEGIRQIDVADRLGISLSGAKSRVQRGRSLLRERMEECCEIVVDVRGMATDHRCRTGCGCCD